MRETSERHARALLTEQLGFELDEDEFEEFVKLALRANHELLRNALKELRGAGRAALKARESGQRAPLLERIKRVYTRKLAEQHRLFPILRLVEDTFRTFLAIWMESHFRTERWWEQHYAWLQKGNKSLDLKSINGIQITAGVSRAMEALLRGVDGEILSGGVVPRIENGHGLLRLSRMSDLEEFFRELWPNIRHDLPDRLKDGAPLDMQVFTGMFRRLREARNSCFHHKEVADRAGVASNAERLLDLVDVHLETELGEASEAFVRPFAWHVPAEARHDVGTQPRIEYRIARSSTIDGQAISTTEVMAAGNKAGAIMRLVDTLTVEERSQLSSLAFEEAPQEPSRSDPAPGGDASR